MGLGGEESDTFAQTLTFDHCIDLRWPAYGTHIFRVRYHALQAPAFPFSLSALLAYSWFLAVVSGSVQGPGKVLSIESSILGRLYRAPPCCIHVHRSRVSEFPSPKLREDAMYRAQFIERTPLVVSSRCLPNRINGDSCLFTHSVRSY